MDIFREAKEKIDLLDLLRSYGFQLRRCGKGWRSNRCPACGESKRSSTKLSILPARQCYVWHCFACGEKGDVISAVMHLEGLSAKEACRYLLERYCMADQEQQKKARIEVIKKLTAFAVKKNKCFHYLLQRKIPEKIILLAQKRGLVYFLPDSAGEFNKICSQIGKELLKKAGLLVEGKIKNTLVLRPLMSPFFTRKGIIGAQFRAITAVHPKAISLVTSHLWWWKGSEKKIAVVEGIIDMLSIVSMGWKGNVLAIAGVGLVDRAIEYIKKLNQPVFVALDGDRAGKEAAVKIFSSVPDTTILSLPEEKDLNDLLLDGVKNWKELIF